MSNLLTLITNITAHRATVAHILDADEYGVGSPSDETLEELGLDRSGGGASWDLREVPEGAKVGERIWL